MGIKERLESQAMAQQIKQQIRLLKAKNAIHVEQHVPGRAAVVSFTWSDELQGKVLIKGSMYKSFQEAGGFEDLTTTEAMQIETEITKEQDPVEPVKEVVTDGTPDKGAESKEPDK
jgi:hypothetical protein